MRALLAAIETTPERLGADGETRDAYTTQLMWRRYELLSRRPAGMADGAFEAYVRQALFHAALDLRRQRRAARRRKLSAAHEGGVEEIGVLCRLAKRVEDGQQVARLRRLLPTADFDLLAEVAEAGSVRSCHATHARAASLRTLYTRYERARSRARAILQGGRDDDRCV